MAIKIYCYDSTYIYDTASALLQVVNGCVSVSCIILLQYLDGLFQKDPKAGGQYHQRQVELYATYDPDKLLPFLRSCNDIPLQKVCVYIRMYT